jgi:hypothetical protein
MRLNKDKSLSIFSSLGKFLIWILCRESLHSLTWIGLPAQGINLIFDLLARLPKKVDPFQWLKQLSIFTIHYSLITGFPGFRSLHGCGAAGEFHSSSLTSSHFDI